MRGVQSGDDAIRDGLKAWAKYPSLYRISIIGVEALTSKSTRIATVFDVTVRNTMVNEIKKAMARKYELTYRAILEEIVAGPIVHADETKGVVYGGGHYVWIFANLTSVAYVYSASRDPS